MLIIKRAQHWSIDVEAATVKPSVAIDATQGKLVTNISFATGLGAKCTWTKPPSFVLVESKRNKQKQTVQNC